MAARFGSLRALWAAASLLLTRPAAGESASAWYAMRSAIASLTPSMMRCNASALLCPSAVRSNPSRMFSVSRTWVPAAGGGTLTTSSPRNVEPTGSTQATRKAARSSGAGPPPPRVPRAADPQAEIAVIEQVGPFGRQPTKRRGERLVGDDRAGAGDPSAPAEQIGRLRRP